MAYAFVQQKENSSAGTGVSSLATGASATITNNNLIVWVVEYYSGSAKTLTFGDTRGLTFVECGNFFSASKGNGKRFGYALIGSNGGATENVTATFSGTVDFPGIYIAEYSGLDATTPFTTGEAIGQVHAAPGTGTDAISSSSTPTLAAQPAMVFGLASDITVGFAPTAGTGFTSRTVVWVTSDSQARPQDKRVTATTAVSATWTSQASHGSDDYSACVMVFKETASGSDTPLTVTEANASLTGQTVTLTLGDSVALDVTNGVLTLSGQDVPLQAGSSFTLPVTNTSLSLQAQDANFVLDTPWVEASLTLTGQSVTLTAQQSVTLTVTEAAATLTAQDVALTADFDFTLDVTSNSLTLTGQDVLFNVGAGNVTVVVDTTILLLVASDVGISPSFSLSSTGSPRRKRHRGLRRLLNIGR